MVVWPTTTRALCPTPAAAPLFPCGPAFRCSWSKERRCPQSGPHLAADLTLASLPPSLPQVGEYFQVQDDYLDFYGDEKVRFGPLPLDILYNCYIDYSRPFYGDEKVIRASTVGGSPQLLHGLQQAPPSAATRSHYQ